MCTDKSNAIRPRICVKKVNRVNKKFKLSFIRAVKEQETVIVAALQSSWFGSTHGGFWSLVRLELASTHIGTVGSWSSRAHTARMNNPETRSDTHTGPLVHHRTHPGNPGLNTDSLGEGRGTRMWACLHCLCHWVVYCAHKHSNYVQDQQQFSRQTNTDATICMCLLRCHLL